MRVHLVMPVETGVMRAKAMGIICLRDSGAREEKIRRTLSMTTLDVEGLETEGRTERGG